jgi:dienelactone hydrolase
MASSQIAVAPAPVARQAMPLSRAGWVLRLVLGLGLLLGATIAFTPTGRVATKAILILPEVFPSAPVRPLLWFSSPPAQEEYSYTAADGQVDCDLYLPGGVGPHGSVILYTGAFGLRRDPGFVQFAEALARSGAVVLAPESSALRAGEISPEEVGSLLEAVAYLRGRPEVDPDRVGIFGFSAGGSLVLLAAETDVGRDEIAFVNIFGAYYDAHELLREVATQSIEADGQVIPWVPDEVTRYAVAKQVVMSVTNPVDAEILSRALLDGDLSALDQQDQLSADGRTVLELFQHPSAARADEILAILPPGTRERLAAISPSTHIDRLKANVYVMHDRSDRFVPFIHSRELASAAPHGTVRSFAEFELFGHVTPNRQVDPPTFVMELAKLFQLADKLGGEFL